MNEEEEYTFPTTVAEVLERMKNFETEESLQYEMSYQPDPTDVFIVTPPKCGTTWMQQIVHGLRTRGSMDFEEISSVIPWLELAYDMGIDIYAPQAARPHAFKTHSAINEIPQGAKYIVIVRDLKDTLLSHYKFFEDFFFAKGSISLESFAREYFIPRKSVIKHIHAVWNRRKGSDILLLCYENMALPFLTGCHFSNTKDTTVTKGKPTKSKLFSPFVYFVSFVVRLFPVKYGRPENMKANLSEAVERVAKFIGIPFDDELREIVVRQADIKFMQEHNNQFDEHPLRRIRYHAWKLPYSETASKVRNGKVGESKEAVPDDIKQKLDALWQEKSQPNLV